MSDLRERVERLRLRIRQDEDEWGGDDNEWSDTLTEVLAALAPAHTLARIPAARAQGGKVNERAVDHMMVAVINCSAIGAMLYLITHDLAWWSLLFLFALCRSSKPVAPDRDSRSHDDASQP